MKRGLILLVVILLISPVLAIEVYIPESFEIDKTVSNGKEVFYYTGSKLVASIEGDLEYKYSDRVNSDINSKSLPFGEPIDLENRFSFTGKELDDNLYNFYTRYYDPNLGRFVSIDPVKENHPYSYAKNNPLTFIDPDGMDNYIFYDDEWIKQAQSAKSAFEFHYGEEFNLVNVHNLEELKSGWESMDLSGSDDKVAIFFHGDMGSRMWFYDAHEGLAASQKMKDARDKATGATYEVMAEYFEDFNMPENLFLFTCEAARGLYDSSNPHQWTPYPNVVDEFLKLGVWRVYAGFYWMSYSEKEGVTFPRESGPSGKLFKTPYDWNLFTYRTVGYDSATDTVKFKIEVENTDLVRDIYNNYIQFRKENK